MLIPSNLYKPLIRLLSYQNIALYHYRKYGYYKLVFFDTYKWEVENEDRKKSPQKSSKEGSDKKSRASESCTYAKKNVYLLFEGCNFCTCDFLAKERALRRKSVGFHKKGISSAQIQGANQAQEGQRLCPHQMFVKLSNKLNLLREVVIDEDSDQENEMNLKKMSSRKSRKSKKSDSQQEQEKGEEDTSREEPLLGDNRLFELYQLMNSH